MSDSHAGAARPPASPADGGPARAGRRLGPHAAHRGLRSLLAIRATLALLGALAALAVGIWLLRSGTVDHTFPPFIAGGAPTAITGYSGPYLVAAVLAGAVGGLLAVSSVTDWWRRHLIGADLEHSHTSLGQWAGD